jgi:hypothetical protein
MGPLGLPPREFNKGLALLCHKSIAEDIYGGSGLKFEISHKISL